MTFPLTVSDQTPGSGRWGIPEVEHRWGESKWGATEKVRVRYFWKTESEHGKVDNPTGVKD